MQKGLLMELFFLIKTVVGKRIGQPQQCRTRPQTEIAKGADHRPTPFALPRSPTGRRQYYLHCGDKMEQHAPFSGEIDELRGERKPPHGFGNRERGRRPSDP